MPPGTAPIRSDRVKSHAWFIDEVQLAGDEHLNAGYVEGYDGKARFDPEPDLALLRSRGLGPESTLVDLGAGTGEFVLAAAQICRRVVAVDVSPAMLKALSTKVGRQQVSNLELVRQGFLTYVHRGELADFVYTKNALHHLPDFWKAVALKRVAAILKQGGVLRLRDLVFSFEPEESEAVIEAWLQAAPGKPKGGWTRSELEIHLRQEYSTFSWLLEPMLHRAGFVIEEATYADSRVFAEYVCVKV
jgi:ubiquinone/menaquinone biosynthesis C-methylase UbiE